MALMEDEEEKQLHVAALQNVQSVLRARQRAEQELLKTKEALEEETRILELLNKTGAALASKIDLEGVVQAVTDAATQVSGAEFGAFFYTATSTEGGALTRYTLSGAPREAFEAFGHPRATPLFGPTFRGAGPIRIADVRNDPRYGQMGPHHGMPHGHLPVSSYLAVPVLARSGEVLGGLFFGHRDCGVFTERAERLVVGIAAQAAIAIDNARMYEDAKRAAEERARLLDAERAARSEIERVSLVKDEFLATLSHELRTPLTAILGWSTLLLSRSTDPATLRAAEIIARNGRAQAQLIDDLLDMNRIVSGKMRLDVQRLELSPIVETVIESLRPAAEAKAIVVRPTIDPHSGFVFGDPNRLQQIVWNLMTNAVKFTPKGGKIEVLVQRVNSHVEVVVHDTGIGVRPEVLPYLFERFRQADSSTRRKYGGLGLGLSIVKHLVELHGGRVVADSMGEGHGTTFTVSLPLRTLHEAPGAVREQPTTTSRPSIGELRLPSLKGIKVLIVEDEPDAREALQELVSDLMATVFSASSADEGLALVKSKRPDIIVSDIGMPGRDGYQFIEDVRGLDPAHGGGIPAIAVTAFARSEDRSRALLAGYQLHLAKPVDPNDFVAAIRSLTGQLRSAETLTPI
jgi:signal transduction histidine kinase/CheY-like chemotaxis protein